MHPRLDWNRRYAEGSHADLEPDPFFLSAFAGFVRPHYPGPATALDLAGGLGRHSLWLAQRGWDVTLVDVSDVGIALAREQAKRLGVALNAVVADLTRFVVVNRYALVLVFFYLERPLFPAIADAVAPGGFLMYRTYTKAALKFGRGPKHPMFLLEEGELRAAFTGRGLDILHYREEPDERGTAELVAWRS